MGTILRGLASNICSNVLQIYVHTLGSNKRGQFHKYFIMLSNFTQYYTESLKKEKT